MTELEGNLRQILTEKNEKIIPVNIKKNVTILGVTGTLEAGSSEKIHIEYEPVSNIDYSNISTTYGFVLQSDGYYENNNKAKASTVALMRVRFDVLDDCVLSISYRSFAENNYDYGTIGVIDTELSNSTSDDSVYTVFCKGQSSDEYKTVEIPVTSGSHFLDFKYKKDGSGDTNDDSFKFKITFPESINMDVSSKLYTTEEELIADTPDEGTLGVILNKITASEVYLRKNNEWFKQATVDTSTGNITAEDIKYDKVAFSNGEKIVGTNPNLIDTSVTTEASIAKESDLLFGKIAYVNGQRIVGTIDDYGTPDYSGNNFEVIDDTLYIKKAVDTSGFFGETENMVHAAIPHEMATFLRNYKDQCIIFLNAEPFNSGYEVKVYYPNRPGDILKVSCVSYDNRYEAGHAYHITDNAYNPTIFAISPEGLTYDDDNTIQANYVYATGCHPEMAGSFSNGYASSYHTIYASAGITCAWCAGNDEIAEGITLGSWCAVHDYSVKPETIDSIAMNYSTVTGSVMASNMLINHTSNLVIEEGVTEVDNGQIAYEWDWWTWTNPEGLSELDNSISEITPYLRWYETESSTSKFYLLVIPGMCYYGTPASVSIYRSSSFTDQWYSGFCDNQLETIISANDATITTNSSSLTGGCCTGTIYPKTKEVPETISVQVNNKVIWQPYSPSPEWPY